MERGNIGMVFQLVWRRVGYHCCLSISVSLCKINGRRYVDGEDGVLQPSKRSPGRSKFFSCERDIDDSELDFCCM